MRAIILTSFRGFYRSRVNLFFCIFFPCILTYLLGSMLEGVYNGDNTIEPIQIVNISQNETSLTEPVEHFLASLQEEGMLAVEKEGSMEKATAKLSAEEIDGIFVMDKDELIFYEGADEVKNRALRTLFRCYLRMEASYDTAYIHAPNVETGGDTLLQDTEYESKGHIVLKGLGTKQSMMDYYAVAMLIMIIFFACIIAGSENITADRKLHIQDRIALSPLNYAKVYLGRVIGSLPMCVVQIAAMMLSSVFLFHADYCDTWQDNLLLIVMFFMVSFAILTFTMLLAILLPIPPVLILLPLSWMMLAISGSFSKDICIHGVSEYSPPYMIQQAAFDLTVFGRREGTIQVILMSGAVFLICFAAGLIFMSRRKGR